MHSNEFIAWTHRGYLLIPARTALLSLYCCCSCTQTASSVVSFLEEVFLLCARPGHQTIAPAKRLRVRREHTLDETKCITTESRSSSFTRQRHGAATEQLCLYSTPSIGNRNQIQNRCCINVALTSIVSMWSSNTLSGLVLQQQ